MFLIHSLINSFISDSSTSLRVQIILPVPQYRNCYLLDAQNLVNVKANQHKQDKEQNAILKASVIGYHKACNVVTV